MDTKELGRRLRHAREKRGISQQLAADTLGVPRTAITQMEAGNRSVSTLELTKLADLYRQPVMYFLTDALPPEEEDVLVALLRLDQGFERDEAISSQLDRCIRLCQEGASLSRLLGRDLRTGPPTYAEPIPQSTGDAVIQGERVAREERRRLGIGIGPIGDVADLISAQDIWVSATHLPEGVSGLHLRHSSIGLAIIVSAHHPRGRQRFSYAHEYAHALLDSEQTAAVTSATNAKDMAEKRANAFAAAFLMPSAGVTEILRQLHKGLPSRQEQSVFDVATDSSIETEIRPPSRSQRITFTDAAIVAHHFGVSYSAAVYRLRSLQHLSQSQCEELLNQESLGRQYLRALAMDSDLEEPSPKVWTRELRNEVAHLAIEAYRREAVSRGRLLELGRSLDIPGQVLVDLAQATSD